MIERIFILVALTLASQSGLSQEAKVNAGDTSLFLGTIGPLFVVQSGLNFQLTHQFDQSWSLEAEAGEYTSGSTSPSISTSYASLGASYFLNTIESLQKLINLKAPAFIRLSYGYRDEKNQFARGKKNIGRRISTGFELSPGIRVTRDYYSLEVIPLSFYFPINKRESREIPSPLIIDRILSLKIGLTF